MTGHLCCIQGCGCMAVAWRWLRSGVFPQQSGMFVPVCDEHRTRLSVARDEKDGS